MPKIIILKHTNKQISGWLVICTRCVSTLLGLFVGVAEW
jgi:hypothetical protein